MNSLVCPHCSRPLAEHGKPCSGITRRHLFFGLFAGLTAAAAIPDVWGNPIKSQPGMPLGIGDYIWTASGDRLFKGFRRMESAHAIVSRPDEVIAMFTLPGDILVVRDAKRPFWMRA